MMGGARRQLWVIVSWLQCGIISGPDTVPSITLLSLGGSSLLPGHNTILLSGLSMWYRWQVYITADHRMLFSGVHAVLWTLSLAAYIASQLLDSYMLLMYYLPHLCVTLPNKCKCKFHANDWLEASTYRVFSRSALELISLLPFVTTFGALCICNTIHSYFTRIFKVPHHYSFPLVQSYCWELISKHVLWETSVSIAVGLGV